MNTDNNNKMIKLAKIHKIFYISFKQQKVSPFVGNFGFFSFFQERMFFVANLLLVFESIPAGISV